MGSIQTDRIKEQNKENIQQFQSSTLEQQDKQQKDEMLSNLSNRLNKGFNQSIIASKNILYLPAKPSPKNDANEIIGMAFIEIIPFFATFKKTRSRRPTFQMIQIQSKMFFKLQERPIEGDYQIQGEIGRGGYGSVARGIERRSGEIRAIKKIQKLSLSIEEKNSLMNQFQILCRLDHPNIIKLYEVYSDSKFLYVVTQICEGGNLLAFVNSNKPSQKTIRSIATQILSAISYMHSLNIFHRDIKLQNVVLVKKVSHHDENIQLKIIDFGLALNLSLMQKSQESDPMGTLMYMSPESIDGKIGISSDVWSCGIALYMMATKKLPYQYTDCQESQLLQKVARGQINRKNLQKLTLGLKVLIMEMLAKSPQSRITAQKALKNPWIKKVQNRHRLSQSKKTEAVKNLLDYDAKNNLISMIEGYLICKRINQQERQHLANIFQEIDEDNSGIIEIGQLKKFYQNNSEHYQQQDVQELLKTLDKNKSGKIDFNQFITAMCSRRQLFQLQHLEEAFDFFDKDKSGKLEKQELQHILNGIEVSQIQYLFAQLDKNNDSVISKKQFLSYLTKQDQ